MRFLFVRPEVCPLVSRFPVSGFLQIPSHDGHPCLRLYPSRYRADSGLSPVRTCARRAHYDSAPALRPGLLSLTVASMLTFSSYFTVILTLTCLVSFLYVSFPAAVTLTLMVYLPFFRPFLTVILPFLLIVILFFAFLSFL